MTGEKILKNNQTQILFLGSGTSTGVPMIGCECSTCASSNDKNNRTRSSVLIRWMEGTDIRNILVDTTTDLRIQALRHGLKRIDAVLFTHPHADHVHGLDELRTFNFMQKEAIPCYGSEFTLSRIETMFDYIFKPTPTGGSKPRVTLNTVNGDVELALFGRKVVPLPVMHGEMEVLGFRLGPIAYITDCNHIPDKTMEKITGVSLLVIGAVRLESHVTHFSLDEAIQVAQRAKAKKTYITHISHHIEHEKVSQTLPENVYLSYDGLEETLEE